MTSHVHSYLKQPDYSFHYLFYSKLKDRATAAGGILTAAGKRQLNMYIMDKNLYYGYHFLD